MKTFRKIAALLGLLLLVFPAWGIEYDYREGLDSFLRESRTGELMDKVPEGAEDFLDDLSPGGRSEETRLNSSHIATSRMPSSA